MADDARIAAVILAAGASVRMGANKMLLALEGEPLVRRAARRALAAGLSPVVVVLGREAERVGAELAGLDVVRTVNEDPTRGIDSSLRAGLEALPAEIRAAVIALADMPLVTSAMLAAIADRHRRTGARVVISEYAEVAAPPMLFTRDLFAELAETGSGRRVANRHPSDAAVVRWPVGALADVDRPEDYDRVRAALGEAAHPVDAK